MLKTISSLSLPVNLNRSVSVPAFIGLSLVSFLVPFSLGHPQWLVGTIVNACLLLAAVFLPKKFILPLIVLPSLGVLSRGLIFGPLTMFLVYFLPFIWLANLALVFSFLKLFPRFNCFISFFSAAVAKSLLLFIMAGIYLESALAPKVFLQLMGLNQFLTALAGGAIAWLIFNFYDKRNPRDKRAA